MEKNVIITISRQFGSNGREIARKLAEYLDISYYNKEILERIGRAKSGQMVAIIKDMEKLIAVNMGVCADFFKDQNQDANGLFTIESKGLLGLRNITELSVNTQIYDMASDFIQKISQREDAVIVGRCADYILKDNPDVISVFCYSDVEERIQWSIDEYQVPAKQAKKIVQEKDAQRSRFYEFYTNQKWGNPRNYTLMINTSKMSTKETVQLLASFYDAKKGILTFKNAFENQYEKDNKY